MKLKVVLLVSLLCCSLNLFSTDYTIDGKSRSEETIRNTSFWPVYADGFFSISYFDIKFQRFEIDFEYVYAVAIRVISYTDYREMPEEGVLMLKLANDEVVKLNRMNIPLQKNSYFSSDSDSWKYVVVCSYLVEKEVLDKIVSTGLKKVRVEFSNGKFVDEEVKPRYVEKLKKKFEEGMKSLEKTVDDGF
jgi:hypothetical protein